MRARPARPWLARVVAALLAVAPAASASGDTVQLEPVLDNSIYEEGGVFSNGAGQHLIAGVTKNDDVVRALIAFDVAGSVPAGSVVDAATLTLDVSQEPFGNTSAHPFTLHRVTAAWGEGASDAGVAAGTGASATPGDATWDHTFFDNSFWAVPGADFDAAVSASQSAGPGLGSVAFGGAGLVADVQGWLDAPETSFGWILRGDEDTSGNARRFDSREHATASVRPRLEIEFAPPTVPAVPLPIALATAPVVAAIGWLARRRAARAQRRFSSSGPEH